MTANDLPSQIDKLINDIGASWRKDSVCTSWILITEWADSEGNQWLEESRVTDLTPWKRLGILYHVINKDEPTEEEDDIT